LPEADQSVRVAKEDVEFSKMINKIIQLVNIKNKKLIVEAKIIIGNISIMGVSS